MKESAQRWYKFLDYDTSDVIPHPIFGHKYTELKLDFIYASATDRPTLIMIRRFLI